MSELNFLKKAIKTWLRNTSHRKWVFGSVAPKIDTMYNESMWRDEIGYQPIIHILFDSIICKPSTYFKVAISASDPKFFDKLDKLLTLIESTKSREDAFIEAEKNLYLSIEKD